MRARVYPQVLGTLSAAQLRSFGAEYLADTRIYRSGKAFLHRQDAE